MCFPFRVLRLLAVFHVLENPLQAGSVLSVADFGAVADSGQDATVPFRQGIAAAKAAGGPVTLRVPEGRYDFFPEQATRRACYFSNATESGSDAQRTIAIDLSDCDGLTVEGEGAVLMMRGKMTMLVAERCQDLALKGLEFDFARPTVSEVTVVEKREGFWVGRVHEDSSFAIDEGKRVRWIGEGWSAHHDIVQSYDPVQRTVWRSGDPTQPATLIEEAGERLLKFHVPESALGLVETGRVFQFRNAYRDQTGMWFHRSRNVTLEDVKIRAMHGFGVLFQYTENVDVRRVEIGPRDGSGRTCTAAADILHFSGCRGAVKIHDSKLSASHDDAMNVHGTHLRIVGIPSPRSLRLRFMHPQSWGFQAFEEGDEIELVRKRTLLPFGEAVVTGVEMSSDPYVQTITLDREVPEGIEVDADVVENVTWTPSVEVVNCDVSQVPTRGFLITTRRPVRIQGNRFFRTQMPAILVEDDAGGWYESGPVHDLTLRGNAFYECGESVIRLNPENPEHGGAVHRNLKVEDNVFTMNGTGAVALKSTEGVFLRGNLFRLRDGSSPEVAALISQQNASGVILEENVIQPASTAALALRDGGFEAGEEESGWHEALPEGVRRVASGNPGGGQAAEIDGGAAIYQDLGFHDPRQGDRLRWSLQQWAADGERAGLEVTFYQWDGRFTAGGTADVAELPAFHRRDFGAWEGDSVRRAGLVDLSRLPAGARIWMRIGAPEGKARVDEVELAVAGEDNLKRYADWARAYGLGAGEDPAEADPDGDRLPNLIEYLLDGTDPLNPDPSAIRAMLKEENGLPIFLYHPRQALDAELIAEYQVGGMEEGRWKPVIDGEDGLATGEDEEGNRWVEVVDRLSDRLFVRLRAAFLPILPPLVANSSFENPDRSSLPIAYTGTSPAGWTFTTSINGGVEEIRDGRFGSLGPEGNRLGILGGDGDQVGYINLGTSGTASAVSEEVGVIQANTRYTLKIAFGQRATGDRHPDGSFGLVSQGNPLGTFTAFSSSSLPAGFTNLTYRWTSPGEGDPLIGRPMRVRMNFAAAAVSGWQQAQFDHVRLEAVAAGGE